jgi:hypothetical protein
MLDRLAAAAHGVDANSRAERRAAAEKIVRPLITQLQGAMSTHGALQGRWREKVSAVASQDWNAVLRATPPDRVFDGRQMVSVNHNALHRLRAASQTAYAALASSYGDNSQGTDLDPTSAPRMIGLVEAMLSGDQTHDPKTGEFSASFKRAIVQLRWWAEKIVALAEGAKSAVEAFKSAEAHAAEVLANVAPASDIEAKPRPVPLPRSENPPSAGTTSSYVDYDPLTKEILTPKPSNEVTKFDVGGARITTKRRNK